jgi:hypothetical protein
MPRSKSVLFLAGAIGACASAPIRTGPIIDHFSQAACVPAGRVENVYPPGWLITWFRPVATRASWEPKGPRAILPLNIHLTPPGALSRTSVRRVTQLKCDLIPTHVGSMSRPTEARCSLTAHRCGCSNMICFDARKYRARRSNRKSYRRPAHGRWRRLNKPLKRLTAKR